MTHNATTLHSFRHEEMDIAAAARMAIRKEKLKAPDAPEYREIWQRMRTETDIAVREILDIVFPVEAGRKA